MRAKFIHGGMAALILATSGAAAADSATWVRAAPVTEVVIGDVSDAYGTSSLTSHVIGSYEFQTRNAAQPLSGGSGVERFFTSASAFAAATPMLPNGVQVERVELRACDTDPAAAVSVNFGPCPNPGGTCILSANVATGTAAVPGCNTFSTTLATPVVINNATQVLAVDVTTGTTSATTFSAVRLFYRLRVSPAPATATFADVPVGHPQRQFVEALAAAGVTGGCTATNFCPDSPLTRGQMAVFLSVALGLHFPN